MNTLNNNKIEVVENSLRHKVRIKGTNNEKMNLLDRMQYYKVPSVSIALINKGQVEWTKEYGVVTFGQQASIAANTLFQAGSISKVFTALGALLLVQSGKLSLDRDVNEYLKSWKIPSNEYTQLEKVTLRRLLSHSAGLTVSGFPGYPAGSKIPSLIEILDGVNPPANTKPVRVDMIPGTEFRYSGGGTTIIQLLIEELTGEPFDSWMAKNVLLKLNMNSSTFQQPLSASQASTAACGHLLNGDRVVGNTHIYPEMAAAGLWSTPTDLAQGILTIQRILQHKTEGFISYNLINEMLTSQIMIAGNESSGLGVFLKGEGKDLMFSHDGQDEGFIACFYGLARRDQGFVIMMNCYGNGWYLMHEITNSIADVYAWPNLAETERVKIYIDPEIYIKLANTYQSQTDDFPPLTITKNGNKLFLIFEDMLPLELYPEAEHRYFTREINLTIEFDSQEGQIDKAVITFDTGECHTYYVPNK